MWSETLLMYRTLEAPLKLALERSSSFVPMKEPSRPSCTGRLLPERASVCEVTSAVRATTPHLTHASSSPDWTRPPLHSRHLSTIRRLSVFPSVP